MEPGVMKTTIMRSLLLKFGDDGLVMKSMGHFDNDEYQYQVERRVE